MQVNSKPILVTHSFLPPLEEYQAYLEEIWKRNWVTNNGPLLQTLEKKLGALLECPNPVFVGNGTLALQFCIQALELKGDILTTPFSFVATASSIAWEGCKPIFVDIETESFNIDIEKLESHLTKNTTAILATHVFGVPCRVQEIESFASKHNLKVIYDAAHAFGTKYRKRSIFRYGDMSACSFHATKLFHTIEGGAVFSEDASLLRETKAFRNFGFDGREYSKPGINGKNSEFHSAMGLSVLPYIERIIAHRKEISTAYDQRLHGLSLKFQSKPRELDYNFAYYPIVFKTEEQLLSALEAFQAREIFPRRYFYPSLPKLQAYQSGSNPTPVSDSIAKRIICLPLYYNQSLEVVDEVCDVLRRNLTC